MDVQPDHGRQAQDRFRPGPDQHRLAGQDQELVLGRGDEAGDHQLPDLQAREGRPFLRQDLRPHQRLRMPLRQVQADEVPGHHLRALRRRGDEIQGPPRAHGPHPAGLAGRPHLVLQEPAEPDRPRPRPVHQGPREGPLFRILHRPRPGRHPAQGEAAAERGGAQGRPGEVRRQVRRLHRRRGDQDAPPAGQYRQGHRPPAEADEEGDLPAEEAPLRQAAPGLQGPQALREPARVDGPRRRPRHPARPEAPRPAGRRPLRHLGPQRPLPAGHQPEQPAEEAHRAQGPRAHHPQRKADAPGSRRRPLRQRQARPGPPGRQPPAAQVPERGPARQTGAVPPEPPRQARRLLRPLGHRRRPRAQAQPVRPAQEDGPRALQAVHLQQAGEGRARPERQGRPGMARSGAARGLGLPGGGRPRAPDHAQPRPHPAPAGHPGLRAPSSSRARPSTSIRSSAPPSTPTSTATRWPSTSRCRSRPRSRPRPSCCRPTTSCPRPTAGR